MIEKLKTLAWFARRPSFWAHAASLALRKTRGHRDSRKEAIRASAWAAGLAVDLGQALAAIGLDGGGEAGRGAVPHMSPELLAEAGECARSAAVVMGGAGDINLLYAAVKVSGARRIVETGVAYGWSSLAILAALDGRPGARLVSVDMPYPKLNNEVFVGIVVPDRLRAPWTVVAQPDRNGLKKAIALQGGTIDLCHYDSDKSYAGRGFGLPLLWAALGRGGVFICDDIQDNFGFRDFIEQKSVPFAVTEFEGKFIGIARKP